MAIITISRGSYFRGKEVAEKLAQKLGYVCISREILLEASEEFNIPEIKLIRAIQDAPTILDRFFGEKEKFVAFIRAALLKHVQKDNVVYHGLFGHFFLQDIPHVLKVRIVGDLEARVADEVKREGIPAAKAREILTRDDAERRKWALQLYGADWWDATLYDLVLHLKAITWITRWASSSTPCGCRAFKLRRSRSRPSIIWWRPPAWRWPRSGGKGLLRSRNSC